MKPLTKEQLRDNAAAMLAFADGKPIELFTQDRWSESIFLKGDAHLLLDCMGQGNHYRPKPQPVSRPWSKPEDVPGPVCWIRWIAERNNERMIVHVDGSGIFSGSQMKCVMFGDDFLKFEYSTDRVTWKPCTVEEDAQ